MEQNEMQKKQKNQDQIFIAQAEQMMDMINTLSLFTRITMSGWMPDLLSELNLTDERYIALFELNLQPNISLKQLAQNLMVSPSNLSVMINALVEQDLVERVPDPDDRRRVLLKLSSKGKQVCQQGEDYSIKQMVTFIRKLSGEDRQELSLASEKMIAIARKIINQYGDIGQ